MKFLFTVLVSQTPVNATQKQGFDIGGLLSGVKTGDEEKDEKLLAELGNYGNSDENETPTNPPEEEVAYSDGLESYDYEGTKKPDNPFKENGSLSDWNFFTPLNLSNKSSSSTDKPDNYGDSTDKPDNFRGPGGSPDLKTDLPMEQKGCFCNHGVARTGGDCEYNPIERCESCDDEYSLSGFSCIKVFDTIGVHECTCTNGRGNRKLECPPTEDCLSCDTGFIQTRNEEFTEYSICEKTTLCYCNNGYASTGENCAYTGYHSCDGCYTGYELVDERCVNENRGELYCLPGERFLDGKCVSCENKHSTCPSQKDQCAYSLMVRREMCCVTCNYREPIPLYESNELDTEPPYYCNQCVPYKGLCWKSRTYEVSCVQKIGGCEDLALTENDGRQSNHTCADLKYAGFCGPKYDQHREFMLKNCPRTCGYCQDPPKAKKGPLPKIYGQEVQFRPEPDDLFRCAIKLPDNAEPFKRQQTCNQSLIGGAWCTPICKHGFILVGSIRCNHVGDLKNDAQCVPVSGSDAEVLRVTESVLTAFLRRDFANTLKRYFQETSIFSVHNMKNECYPTMVYETIAQKVGFLNNLFPEGKDGRASDELIILGEDVLSRNENFINVKVDTMKFRRTEELQDDMKEIQPDIMILKNLRIVFQKNGSGLGSEWSMAQFHATVPCIHVAANIYDSQNLVKEGDVCYSTLEGILRVCCDGLQCGDPFNDDINYDFDVLTCRRKTETPAPVCENTPPSNTVYGTDHNARCAQLYQRGMCFGTYNAYMRSHCAKTCNFCGPNAVQNSQDRYITDSEIVDVPDKCKLEKSEGLGFYPIKRWYYDPLPGLCKQFDYSGSSGNENNFETESICLTECSPNEKYYTTALGNLAYGEAKNEYPNADYFLLGPAKVGEYCTNINWPNDVTRECEEDSSCAMPENHIAAPNGMICRPTGICSLPKEPGDCGTAVTEDEETMYRAYYFDSNTQTCKAFNWCGGTKNDNNFVTEDLCLDACCPEGQDCSVSVCEPGFYFDPGCSSCRKNVCICRFGSRKVDDYCPQPGQNDCSECMWGYHLVGRVCVPNNCICPHGFTVSQDKCIEHNVTSCDSCILGFHLGAPYHLMFRPCEPNICTCQNGTPRSYEFCSKHGEEECEFCNDGYSITRDHRCTAATCHSNLDCACGSKRLQSCNTWYNVCEPEEAPTYNRDVEQVAHVEVNTLLSVRCCKNGEKCRGVFPVETEAGESRSVCFNAHTYGDAQIICEYYDMRLCSYAEIIQSECLDDGCNYTGLDLDFSAALFNTSTGYGPSPPSSSSYSSYSNGPSIHGSSNGPSPPSSSSYSSYSNGPSIHGSNGPSTHGSSSYSSSPPGPSNGPSSPSSTPPSSSSYSSGPPGPSIHGSSNGPSTHGSSSYSSSPPGPSIHGSSNGPSNGPSPPYLIQKEEDNELKKEKKEDEVKEDKENIESLNNSKKKSHMKFLQLSPSINAEPHSSETQFWILPEQTCVFSNNAPENGTMGDCLQFLALGESCTPICNEGYALTHPAAFTCEFAKFGDIAPTLTGGGGCVPCDQIPFHDRVMIGPFPKGHMIEEECCNAGGCYDRSQSSASFGNVFNRDSPIPACFKRDGSISTVSQFYQTTQDHLENILNNFGFKSDNQRAPNPVLGSIKRSIKNISHNYLHLDNLYFW